MFLNTKCYLPMDLDLLLFFQNQKVGSHLLAKWNNIFLKKLDQSNVRSELCHKVFPPAQLSYFFQRQQGPIQIFKDNGPKS